jgi:Phosphotransferase enzyme family
MNLPEIPAGLNARLASLFPGTSIVEVSALAPDSGAADTLKAEGYGSPLRLVLRDAAGRERAVVFRTATSDVFGHDRRSDRAAEVLLDWDTFGLVPGHVRVLDTGAVLRGGGLLSLGEAGEFYLLTDWAPGSPYADDLRRVVAEARCNDLDRARADALARHAARIHGEKIADADRYRRSVRDLLGHGEGIFGIVDGYAPETPGAAPERLRRIEESCLAWRWDLRTREGRLARTHGDYHPFNVIFEEGTRFTLLDASRGCVGDPADDVTAMAVNYFFFAAASPQAWKDGTGPLWRIFWATYLEQSGDGEILQVLAPWLAWRCLVVACPRFYPRLPAQARDRMLRLAEQSLSGEAFDPANAGRLLA